MQLRYVLYEVTEIPSEGASLTELSGFPTVEEAIAEAQAYVGHQINQFAPEWGDTYVIIEVEGWA